MRLIIFQENNFETSTYMPILEEEEKYPVIYMQVFDQIFVFIINDPGLSLSEFVEFCDQETSFIIYEKKIKFN